MTRYTQRAKRLTGAALVAAVLAAGPMMVRAEFYPDTGDLFYDGLHYADSIFLFSPAGPWSGPGTGYEHDFHIVHPLFFQSCTTFTNLPSGYDDCPTAGVFDSNGPVFSFGSYDSAAIASNWWYMGGWFFGIHGFADHSPFNLITQENQNHCFGIPSPWCMFSIAGRHRTVLRGYINWLGVPTIMPW